MSTYYYGKFTVDVGGDEGNATALISRKSGANGSVTLQVANVAATIIDGNFYAVVRWLIPRPGAILREALNQRAIHKYAASHPGTPLSTLDGYFKDKSQLQLERKERRGRV